MYDDIAIFRPNYILPSQPNIVGNAPFFLHTVTCEDGSGNLIVSCKHNLACGMEETRTEQGGMLRSQHAYLITFFNRMYGMCMHKYFGVAG